MIDAAGEPHMFRHELGSALTMELIGLSILRLGTSCATDDDAAALFTEHHRESCAQIAELGEIFRTSGWDVDGHGSPAAEALWAQSRLNCRRPRGAQLDIALLRDAAALERHEIAAYEMLADAARTIERDDCARTLGEILAAERRTLTLATALAARHPSR